MTVWGNLLVGIIVVVAIGFGWFGIWGHNVFNNLNRRAIDKHVTEEEAVILKAHLQPFGKSTYLPCVLMVLSGLNVFGILSYSANGWEISTLLLIFTFTSSVVHLMMFVGAVLGIVCALLQLSEHSRYALPTLGEYLTDTEAYFLFWLAGKEDDYDSEFLSKQAVFPEHLVPILKNWESVKTFASTYDRLRKTLKDNDAYLTVSQRIKQKELVAELREKTKVFVPFYQLLLDAVDTEALDEKKVAHIKEIKKEIPVTLEHMAVEISGLDKGILATDKATGAETRGVVLQELKKVVDSTKTTERQRKEASKLFTYIQDIEQKEAMEREKDSVQMEALAVIQASRLLYGISEEEVERG